MAQMRRDKENVLEILANNKANDKIEGPLEARLVQVGRKCPCERLRMSAKRCEANCAKCLGLTTACRRTIVNHPCKTTLDRLHTYLRRDGWRTLLQEGLLKLLQPSSPWLCMSISSGHGALLHSISPQAHGRSNGSDRFLRR